MDKLLLSAEEAGELMGVGCPKVYELLRVGGIESVRVGRCRRIPQDALKRYVERLRDERRGCEAA